MTDHPPMQDKQILSEEGKTLLEGAKCKHGVPKDWISGCHECYLEVFPKHHQWFMPSGVKWECCRACGIVRRADDNNSPCKGKVKMREPEKPMKSIPTPTGEERESAQECPSCVERRAKSGDFGGNDAVEQFHCPNPWHDQPIAREAQILADFTVWFGSDAVPDEMSEHSDLLWKCWQAASRRIAALQKRADTLNAMYWAKVEENAELRKRMVEG